MFNPENLTSIIVAFVGGSAFKVLIDWFFSRFNTSPTEALFAAYMRDITLLRERISKLEALREEEQSRYNELYEKYSELSAQLKNSSFGGV